MRTHPEVLCAGIVVADHVCTPVAHMPVAGELVLTERILLTLGGCAANVAVDLVRMGVSAGVSGRVGEDVFGRIVGEMLREQGVDVSALRPTPGEDTSQTMIINVEGEDRRFIHTFGANAQFSVDDIPTDALGAARALYLGGYLLMPRVRSADLLPVLKAARAAGTRTILDVVTPGPSPDYLSRLSELLPYLDVFLPNRDEAELITGETNPVRQAERFHELGVGTAVVTLGGEGAVLISDSARLRSGSYSVSCVDGSGGGDAFAAGFVVAMLKDLGAADCLRYASALGASCVREVGTTTGVFHEAECEAFLKGNELPIEKC